ncbi:MAG: DUF2125 domain-containing protein [Rhodobacteraceae bacterium]|nr:DUF2125 domain-containing protein [Paracoccaceae bacterium]
MRILLAVVIFAASAWAGYWVLGSRAVTGSLETWFDEREAEGWAVHVDDVSTTGFPNRFDTTLTDLDLADPDTGWAWHAPFFQILTLSYKPNHVIVVWPDRQQFATPHQTLSVTSDTLRGSVVVDDTQTLTLDRATVEFARVGLASTADWRAALDGGQIAIRRTPLRENSYDLVLEARNLTLPRAVHGILAESGLVGDTAQGVRLDASVVFDRPWDRGAIEDRRPQPRSIDLRLARATWGELDLKIAGTLRVDPRGVPNGTLTVQATNWREMLQLAEASRKISPQVLRLLERGFEALASLSGNPRSLDVPLRFQNGLVTVGGLLPLGPAPRLVLR